MLEVLRVLKVLVLLVLGAASAAQAPAPQPRDGVITGRIVDAATGRPVSGVVVSLTGTFVPSRIGVDGGRPGTTAVLGPAAVPRILTGADGRFAFRDLPSGTFNIAATRAGYADGASGRRIPNGGSQPIVLTDARRSADAAVRVWKYGAIAGTVIDEAGEAVVGLQLRTLVRTVAAGRRRFVPAGAAAFTDDRGMYRFSNLLAGEYLVVASAPAIAVRPSVYLDVARTGRGSGLIPMPPGTGAGSIEVGDALFGLGRGGPIPSTAGERPALDSIHRRSTPRPPSPRERRRSWSHRATSAPASILQLHPVATARLSGTLVSAAGPVSMATIRLWSVGFDEVALEQDAPATTTDAGGGFTFPAVPLGEYTMRAAVSPPPQGSHDVLGEPGFWLRLPVTVTEDADGMTAILQRNIRVSGRFEFEGAGERPSGERLAQIAVVVEPFNRPAVALAPTPTLHENRSTGQFNTVGYPAGKYFVRVAGSPQGWMFKSAMAEGVDVSETPLDLQRDLPGLVITFTDRWTGIGGTVAGPGADSALVLVFPTDAQAWTNYGSNPRRLRSAAANARGEFGLSSLPQGDYYVVAIPEEQSADWREARTLEALARGATQVTIGEGDQKRIELRVREVKP